MKQWKVVCERKKRVENSSIKENWEMQHYINFPEKKIYEIVEKNGTSFCDCYHYTTMDTFWNMIKSDLMYARHVRFSNDSKEYKLGEKIIDQILEYKNEENWDFYMICFCTKRDLLSQWREYAKGGVCLGFDLSDEEFYSILCNEETQKLNEKNSVAKELVKYTIPQHGGNDEKKCVYNYAKLLKVFYVGKKYKKIRKKYKLIKDMVEVDMRDKYMHYMIPYIKHKGFKEEEEARLVFSVEYDDAEYQVNYLEEGGIKKPYIKVEFGQVEEKNREDCTITVDHIGDFNIKFNKEISQIEKEESVSISVHTINKHNNGQIIIGCCKKQKEIFERIDYWLQEWNFKHPEHQISMWCKGHLPIREITIGPCLNIKAVQEGIQHYIDNIYWLKYAKVRCSSIPYREKRDI